MNPSADDCGDILFLSGQAALGAGVELSVARSSSPLYLRFSLAGNETVRPLLCSLASPV